MYLLVCALPKRRPEDWQHAQRIFAELFARLGGGRRGAFIATAAYSWFCFRDSHDGIVRAAHQIAQDTVEGHLRNPSEARDIFAENIRDRLCAAMRTND